LIDVDGNGKIVETKYECGSRVVISVDLSDTCCIKFIHWEDNLGNIISTKPQDTITLTSDSVLIAIYEKTDFITYTVIADPPEANNSFPKTHTVACGSSVNYGNGAEILYANAGWEFIGWSVEPNDNNITITGTEEIFISKFCHEYTITAHYEEKELPPPVLDIQFYIRASEHPQTDPTRKNYRIPIFIKADEDVSNAMIDSLVIEIDRSIFYPRRVDNTDGTMKLHIIDSVIQMIFENVTVPSLLTNEEKLLLTIRGDVLLGINDSSEIRIDTVKFAEDLAETPELFHGFITLDLCGDGGGRIVSFDYTPEIIVKNNPVSTNILEVHCKTIERGDYTLEIVDMYGASTVVQDFTVSGSRRIFDFDLDISNFSAGAYFIIMHTPSAKYSTKFVRQ
jgi:hypothetical protein